MSRNSSRFPSPKYAAVSNLARFCVNVPTTSNPSVFASWRNSVSDASNSASLTLDNCTAATMARAGFWSASCIMDGAYQAARPKKQTALDLYRVDEAGEVPLVIASNRNKQLSELEIARRDRGCASGG
jgi:hypothetical protein